MIGSRISESFATQRYAAAAKMKGPKICSSSRLLAKLKYAKLAWRKQPLGAGKDIPVPTRSEDLWVRTSYLRIYHSGLTTREKESSFSNLDCGVAMKRIDAL